MGDFRDYIRPRISNGNKKEQALIRRWWHECEGAQGLLVWEYRLKPLYADAVWFPTSAERGERDGRDAARRFPLAGSDVVLCEGKSVLNPSVMGQALVHSVFAANAQASLRRTVVFAERGSEAMRRAARQLGLWVVIGNEDPETPTPNEVLTTP